MVSVNVDTGDDYNVEVYGQTNSYCWDDKCQFPPIKSKFILYIMVK